MLEPKPDSLYKYCSVDNIIGFDKDSDECKEYALKNLFSEVQKFSSRTMFNDIFDTKINLAFPTISEVKELGYLFDDSDTKEQFKSKFNCFMKKHSVCIDNLFDKYLIYCLSYSCDNNLMWGHYANSHKGICIEFDTDQMSPHKITYVDTTATFNILDYMKYKHKLLDPSVFAEKIINMFNVKLKEWDYENEYRIILSKKSYPLISKDYGDFALVKFEPSWVKSIIFGFNMQQTTREFIIDNIPYHVKFKETYIDPESNSKILIRDYKSIDN